MPRTKPVAIRWPSPKAVAAHRALVAAMQSRDAKAIQAASAAYNQLLIKEAGK